MERNCLRISVPAGVELTLAKGFLEGDEIKPSRVELGRKGSTFVFYDLPVGDYHYIGSGKGYFTRSKALFFSEEKAALGLDIVFDPLKKTGQGYEPTEKFFNYNDEVQKKVIPADPAMWESHRDLFVTPGLDPKKEPDRVATEEELLAFLNKTVRPENNGYLFTLCKTEGFGMEMPAALFTKADLRGVKTLEEAAAKLKLDKRLTVHYQAQIHGNEPAAGEGAMAIIAALAGKRGEAWLDKLNVLVIPRVNIDGARAFTRNDYAKKINLNRDFTLCESVEIRAIQKAYSLFHPEIFVDGHEFTKKPGARVAPFDDLMLGVAAGISNGKAIGDLNLALMKNSFSAAMAEGLRVTTYSDEQDNTQLRIANSVNPSTGRLYFGLRGSLTLLIESRGITAGKEAYLRRTVSHIIVTESVLNFACQRFGEIREAVRAERTRIREAGKLYDPNRKFVLTTDISKDEKTAMILPRPRFDLETGECIAPDAVDHLYFYDVALRTRPYPTAYVLPKGASWEKQVVEILTLNGIRFREIPAGGSVPLCQYIGSAQRAFLANEKVVSFKNGAYLIPVGQEEGLLAATLLEPDCTDAGDGKGSLAQGGIITPTTGVFPIYRYVHDLPDGRIPTV